MRTPPTRSSKRSLARLRKPRPAINDLLGVMAKLRSPKGCPWDRVQSHMSIRLHAIEEVYELVDAIEKGDDHEMLEELGDLLLQVVFHCQLAKERHAFDFEQAARHIVDKLIRRHPHVFGDKKVKSVDAVWTQWEQIKRAEKHGTRHERTSVFDGIPKHLPSLLRTEKLIKKARKAGFEMEPFARSIRSLNRAQLAKQLFELARYAQSRGWSCEALLRAESKKTERTWRKQEARATKRALY